MNNKKTPKLAAVIDIDSNTLKMRVSQLKKGKICDLDILEYPMRLGHEVFTNKKLSFESLRKLSSLLHGYEDVLAEYGVKNFKTVATTTLREAKNRSFLIDQLNIQNKIQVEVLEDKQEKALIYWEILNNWNHLKKEKSDNALICYIGAGTIGLAVYDGKQIIFSQNIPIGSLKLHDMLGDIQNLTENFDTVIEEYLNSILWHINIPLESGRADHLILVGNGVRLIAKICGFSLTNGRYELDCLRLKDFFEQIRTMSSDQIYRKYNLSEEVAELLYFSLAIAINLMQ